MRADNHSRFDPVVDLYARYRPGYPPQLIDWLRAQGALSAGQVVADVGSGTGALTALFLDAGHQVYGVEPNARMREVAERRFHAQPQFVSVDGTAEAISLPDHVAHLITVGQALHWFDLDQSREEFTRVLAPGGWVALAWNLPCEDDSVMGRGFTQVWRAHVQSRAVDRGPRPDLVNRLFEGRPTIEARLRHAQRLDREGLIGRVRSSSLAPPPDDPGYAPMIEALDALFTRCQRDGAVSLAYDTLVVCGQLTAPAP